MHDYDWLLLAAFSLLVLAPAPFLGLTIVKLVKKNLAKNFSTNLNRNGVSKKPRITKATR